MLSIKWTYSCIKDLFGASLSEGFPIFQMFYYGPFYFQNGMFRLFYIFIEFIYIKTVLTSLNNTLTQ